MRDCDAALLRGMLKLLVTANVSNFIPAVFLKLFDNLSAVHLIPYRTMMRTLYASVNYNNTFYTHKRADTYE
jgi:hypothetical protein